MRGQDNHIAAAGGISEAVRRTAAYLRSRGLEGTPVEVEAATQADVDEALLFAAGCGLGGDAVVTRIMLDNMRPSDVAAAVARVAGRVQTEASGGVTVASAGALGATGVTFVSSGALTHSVVALDISLNIVGELYTKTVAR